MRSTWQQQHWFSKFPQQSSPTVPSHIRNRSRDGEAPVTAHGRFNRTTQHWRLIKTFRATSSSSTIMAKFRWDCKWPVINWMWPQHETHSYYQDYEARKDATNKLGPTHLFARLKKHLCDFAKPSCFLEQLPDLFKQSWFQSADQVFVFQ